MAQFFLSACTVASPLRVHFFYYERYTQVNTTDWAQTGQLLLGEASRLLQMVPYIVVSDGVRPLLPKIPSLVI